MKHTLGEIGEPYIGLTYSPADVVPEGGVIVFRSSNIKDGEIDYCDIVRVNKKLKESLITRKDDLLICARNGSPRLIGKNALLKENDANQTFGAFMLVYRSPDNHFIHQLLSTKSYFSQVSENLGARINQITTANIKDFEFFFPMNKDERDKISRFLDLIDQRIAIQNRVIEKYESLIRAIYGQLFSGLSGKHMQLGELVLIQKGKQLNSEFLQTEGKYYVMNGGIEPSGYYDKANSPADTISISEGGNSCGYVQYNTAPFWSGGHCYTLSCSDESVVDYKYLFHYLKHHEEDIKALRIGSGLPNIQKKDIERFPVVVPAPILQRKLALVFGLMTKRIRLEKVALNNLLLQKGFMLSNLFI